jgi:hypothetical protein
VCFLSISLSISASIAVQHYVFLQDKKSSNKSLEGSPAAGDSFWDDVQNTDGGGGGGGDNDWENFDDASPTQATQADPFDPFEDSAAPVAQQTVAASGGGSGGGSWETFGDTSSAAQPTQSQNQSSDPFGTSQAQPAAGQGSQGGMFNIQPGMSDFTSDLAGTCEYTESGRENEMD